MNKLFFCLLLISTPLFAQDTPVITTREPEETKRFNPYASHWLFSFGFEGMKYEVPFEYDGERKDFSPGKQELWGGRIGVGGEIYLGAGFITSTRLEGYYVGTLFARRLNAGPDDEDEEFGSTKKTGQVFGFDVSQSLGYMFNFKTKNPFMDEWAYLTVEPFIEGGVGMAWAHNRLSYEYDTGPSPGVREGFQQTVKDQLVNARIGGGINLTSSSGYFFFMKANVNTFDITERKVETFTKPNQGTRFGDTEKLKDVKIDPIITYAIGGGYKF